MMIWAESLLETEVKYTAAMYGEHRMEAKCTAHALWAQCSTFTDDPPCWHTIIY